MLVIRFLRKGKKHQPFFKIVVTDKRNPPRAGRFLDEVGFYDPINKEVGLEKEKIKKWINEGAKPSSSVHNLLVREGVIKGEKIAVHSTKKEESSEEKEESEKETKEKKEEKVEEVKEGAKEEEPKEKEKPKKKEAEEKAEKKEEKKEEEKPS